VFQICIGHQVISPLQLGRGLGLRALAIRLRYKRTLNKFSNGPAVFVLGICRYDDRAGYFLALGAGRLHLGDHEAFQFAHCFSGRHGIVPQFEIAVD
jgi:hypothetical protein